MIVVLAVVLMLVPLGVVVICEEAAKRGRGPWAEPDRMPVLDGRVEPAPRATPPKAPPAKPAKPAEPTELVFTDPRDAERCGTESRLVRELLAGTLGRAEYHTGMAALAAGAVSPPVRLPGDAGETPT